MFGLSWCQVLIFRPWLWLSWGREQEVSVKVPRSVCDPGEVLCSHCWSYRLLRQSHSRAGKVGMAASTLRCSLASRQPQHLRFGSKGRVSRRGSQDRAGTHWPCVQLPGLAGCEWDWHREGWGPGEPALHR